MAIETEISHMKEGFNNCECSKTEEVVKNVKRQLMQTSKISLPNQIIAFSASLDHDISLGELQTIEYNRVLTNVGGAYDARHGHFIVPVRGLYMISVASLNKNGQGVDIEVVKNGVQLVAFFCDDHGYNQASQTIVVELQENDMVWVRHFKVSSQKTIYGRPNQLLNTFSGVLLFQM